MADSASTAPADRPRLIPARTLAGFGLLTAAAMGLLFPYQSLVDASLAAPRGDRLALSYLSNLLRGDGDPPQLRFALAEQHASLGDPVAAHAALTPLATHPDAAIRLRARAARWRYLQASRPALDDDQADMLAQLLGTPGLPLGEHLGLVSEAAGFGRTDLARAGIEALAQDPALDAQTARAAAIRLLHAGHATLSARLQLLAAERAPTHSQRREDFLAAMRHLQAHSDFATAFELADRHLGPLADDAPTLTFLIGLARAANAPQRAAEYARALIRTSLIEQLDSHGGLGGLVPVAAEAVAPPPFDTARYQLAYDTFLAAGALADALALAQSAVRQAPHDAAWRTRLAQVSEWQGLPAQALAQWLHLARAGDASAWPQVLRLAPGLFDHRALLAARQAQLDQQPTDAALLARIATSYEQLGDPEAGIAFLRAHLARHPAEAGFDSLATLAERAGHPDQAARTLADMDARYGPSLPRAMRRAVLHIQQGALGEAMQVLDGARAQAADSDDSFWQLRASLAGLLQDHDTQRDALAHLVASGRADRFAHADLVELLRAANPGQAARLAERGWRQFGDPVWLRRSLELHLAAGDHAAMGRLFDALDPDDDTTLNRDPALLRLRGQWHQGRGAVEPARRDFEAALALAPGDAATRESLLWLLVDAAHADTLASLLARHEADWARDAGLHDALAAAQLLLSRPQRALDHYLLPRARAHRDDFLWLMQLADALEAAGDRDRAWRLRQSLWQRPVTATPEATALAQARQLARVRLARLQQPGDAALALMRALLREDADPLASPAVRDLVMRWWLEQADPAGARGFLMERYARALTRPHWAEAALSLAEDDTVAMTGALARADAALPAEQRADLAERLARPDLAIDALADAARDQRDNDALQLRLTRLLREQSHQARIEVAHTRLDSLQERQQRAELSLRVSPRLRLSVSLSRVARSRRDGANPRLPGSRGIAVAARWATPDGAAELGLARRDGFDDHVGTWIGYQGGDRHRWRYGTRLGFGLPAEESTALRIAGMKDELQAELAYQLTGRDRIGLSMAHGRYASQQGLALGRADQWQLDFSHRLSTGQPEWTLGAYLGGFRFRPQVGADAGQRAALARLVGEDIEAALPDSYLIRGLSLSLNERLRSEPGGLPAPYARLDVNQASGRGTGYGLALGLSGSLTASGQWVLGAQADQGGQGEAGRTERFFFDYHHFF
jgi:hypothetical protein